jgi:hypothetical protein
MIIDCGRCTVRSVACESCAVTFITEVAPARAPAAPSARPMPASAPAPPRRSRGTTTTTGKPTSAASREPVIELDAAEMRALAALANAGLIPPLRYAPSMAKAC